MDDGRLLGQPEHLPVPEQSGELGSVVTSRKSTVRGAPAEVANE